MTEKTNTGSVSTEAAKPKRRSTHLEPVPETAAIELPTAPGEEKLPDFLQTGPTLAERKQAAAERAEEPTVKTPPAKVRDQVIDQAASLISGDRDEQYGPAQLSFQNIADVWGVILGKRPTEKQVGLMLAGLKLARLSYDIDHTDSWTDMIGYAALGAEVHETDVMRQTREAL